MASSHPGFNPVSSHGLAAFVAAVEAGSIGAAAESLCLTQPAVSKRLIRLEDHLGVVLLDRDRRGVRPTAAGKRFYPLAQEALAAIDRAAATVRPSVDEQAGRLMIASSHTIGEFILPTWLSAFRAATRRPALRVDVDVSNSRAVVSKLRNRDADIGFVEGLDTPGELQCLDLMDDELVIVVGPHHRWASRDIIQPRDLLTEPYYTREEDSGTRAVAAAALRMADVELVPTFETQSIQALKRAVVDGGFTILSRVAVAPELETNRLRELTLRGVRLDRTLRAVRVGVPRHADAARELWIWLSERESSESRRTTLPLAPLPFR